MQKINTLILDFFDSCLNGEFGEIAQNEAQTVIDTLTPDNQNEAQTVIDKLWIEINRN